MRREGQLCCLDFQLFCWAKSILQTIDAEDQTSAQMLLMKY